MYSSEPTKNDQWIYEFVFPQKTNGVFVDVGAAEGEGTSSTYFLEKIGWTGICVEPSDCFFPRLKTSRNRHSTICEKMCIGERNNKTLFVENRYTSRRLKYEKKVFDSEAKLVDCITLESLLQKHNINHVDYLSLDIEGGEHDALRNLPFDKYTILAISSERDVRRVLGKYGFFEVINPFNTTDWEKYYLHPTMIERFK